MNKNQLLTFFTLLLSIQLVAQSYVPVVFIVSDFSTNKNVNGAQVSIRQAGWATKSTGTDGKVSFDNVPVGAINFIITKDGYQLYEGEENVSTDVRSNTFRIPLTIIPTTKDKILVTGEVTDKDGRDVEGAWVEVKAANIIQNGLTDKSGNYSIEISLNTGYTISNLAIEAKKGDCKVKQSTDIPRGNVVSKDIKLDCQTNSVEESPSKSKNPISSVLPVAYEDEYFQISLKECRRQGGTNLLIKLQVTSLNDDNELLIHGRNSGYNGADATKVFDNENNMYLVATTKIANKIVTGDFNFMKLIEGVPTELTLTFEGINSTSKSVSLLELHYRGNKVKESIAKFKNIEIK